MSTIQIVEDSPDIAELIRHYLKRAGYETVVVGSGRDALTKARQSTPDLVVLDIMLPDLDGLQVCQALRGDPATATVPILMLTAKGEEADRVRGLDEPLHRFPRQPRLARRIAPRKIKSCREKTFDAIAYTAALRAGRSERGETRRRRNDPAFTAAAQALRARRRRLVAALVRPRSRPDLHCRAQG